MSSEQKTKKPYHVFYSYADKDSAYLDKLEAHLSALVRQGEIVGWHKRNISAGAVREDELTKHIDRARIILLLISQNFIASDYCFSREMKHALQRCENRRAMIIPILLRPCYWKELEFSQFERLPSYDVPVTMWHNRDLAFLDIAQGIRNAIHNLRTYEELHRMGQADPTNYIMPPIRPSQEPPRRRATPETPVIEKTTRTARPASRTPTTTQHTGKKSDPRKVSIRANAQIAQASTIATRPTKKSLPKRSILNTIKTYYFSSAELNVYKKGKYKEAFGFMLAFCVVLDVIGLAIISQGWFELQALPLFIFLVSVPIYFLGIFNINLFVAISLAAVYCGIWLLIGLLYLHWNLITILILSLIFLVMRFLLFQGHQKSKR